MTIVVEKPKFGVRGKRANFYRAYTGEPGDYRTQEICDGAPGESMVAVYKRAIAQLVFASNNRVLHVRTATPGTDSVRDVWILNGDPVFGFEYGRVRADSNGEKPTLQITCSQSTKKEVEALATMLSHMADSYPEESWPEFLWIPHSVHGVDLDAIRAEIRRMNTERLKHPEYAHSWALRSSK